MNKDKIIYILRPLLMFVICILMVIYMIYIVEQKINEAYKLGFEYSRVNTENQMFDDWLDFYEEYYELYADYKALEERLKNQPSNEAYIEQIVDDFELAIELQKYYYQENITSHSFGDWLQINYPALYQRIESYF